MKNVLSGLKVYDYERNMSAQMGSISELQREAIEFFSSPDRVGFVVPTNNFQFIFTSNIYLPNDDEVSDSQDKKLARAQLMHHRNAIGSRCKPWMNLDLDKDAHWGWLCDVLLDPANNLGFQLDGDQKVILIDWIDCNWDDMKHRSVRTLEDMIEIMEDYPESYEDYWNSKEFLK